MTCLACRTDVPPAAFCGACGARLEGRGDGRGRLRMGAYAAAPGEQVLRLAVASTLFPHLSHRSRTAFRSGLAVLFIALIALALLRWQAPLVVISALGLPLVFALYLYEAGVHRDLTLRVLLPTVAMGIALGLGWALLTGSVVADFYDVSLGAQNAGRQAFLVGVAIPVGSAVLMLVPVVVMRFVRTTGEALDGYAIGVLGALSFTAAGTLTRLAPQFATGVVARERPPAVLLVQAGLQGVAIPLTAAALAGLVGTALWFGRRALVVSSVLLTVVVAAILGLMEVTPEFQGLHFGAHMMIAVLALVALRIGMQTALLHEDRDPMDQGGRVLCPHCEHVVPDMAFCPNCGCAGRAASRTSRVARRSGVVDAPASVRPGYAVPAGWYDVAPDHHTTPGRLFTTLGAGVGVAVAAATTAAVLATPVVPRYTCPPDCGRPPIGQPIESNPRFTAADGEFSVQYPGPGSAYEASLKPDGVELNFVAGDTGTMQLFGMPAEKRSPKQILDGLLYESYPNASIEYEIPNAMVGYQPGYGFVADEYPQDSSGTFTRLRVVALIAVKDDYALIAAAIGPYHRFSPDFGTGHPSGVNQQLALDMGKYVNSFRWLSNPTV